MHAVRDDSLTATTNDRVIFTHAQFSKELDGVLRDFRPWPVDLRILFRPRRRMRQALALPKRGVFRVLYLTAILAVAALIYLGYAMIRPEHF